MRDDLIKELRNYKPFNEQEERDLIIVLDQLENNPSVFMRDSLMAHMTASGWTVNRDRSMVLMAYHRIYDSWAWLGGHADGNEDLLEVAMREVCEESGVRSVTPVTGNIFSVEVLTVDGHEKRGAYVPSHLHLNITYLLEADDAEMLRIKEDENSGVRWFTPEDALAASSEPWFKDRIYSKLIAKSLKTG